MVLCLIYGCGTKSGRDKGAQFSKFPEIIINEGEEARKLSELRIERWILAISREDLKESHMKHGRVCRKHYVSGTTAKRWDTFNVDWVPSLCLGHGKKVSGKKLKERLDLSAKRDERRRHRESRKVKAQDRQREQLEVAAKKQKINEPGIKVEDIAMENVLTKTLELRRRQKSLTICLKVLRNPLTRTGLLKMTKRLLSTQEYQDLTSYLLFSDMFHLMFIVNQ